MEAKNCIHPWPSVVVLPCTLHWTHREEGKGNSLWLFPSQKYCDTSAFYCFSAVHSSSDLMTLVIALTPLPLQQLRSRISHQPVHFLPLFSSHFITDESFSNCMLMTADHRLPVLCLSFTSCLLPAHQQGIGSQIHLGICFFRLLLALDITDQVVYETDHETQI